MHKRLAGMTDGSFFKKPGWVDGEKPAGHTRQVPPPWSKWAWAILTTQGFFLSPNLVWFAFAAFVYCVFPYDYSAALTFRASWIAPRLAINFAAVYFYYGFWEVTLYVLRWSKRKFNPSTPNFHPRLLHNVWYSSLATLQWTVWEVIFVHLYATKKLPCIRDHEVLLSPANLARVVLWTLAIPVWRSTHFYFCHRFIHTRFMYKYVHSLHHRNSDIEPFAGMAMHPVEHLYYFSCVAPSLYFSMSPFHMLWNGYHLLLSPAASHSGWEDHMQSDQFHYLHHARFECNYGSASVPLDALFGTLQDSVVKTATYKGGGADYLAKGGAKPDTVFEPRTPYELLRTLLPISAKTSSPVKWDYVAFCAYTASTWLVVYKAMQGAGDSPWIYAHPKATAAYVAFAPMALALVLLSATGDLKTWSRPFHLDAHSVFSLHFALGFLVSVLPVYHILASPRGARAPATNAEPRTSADRVGVARTKRQQCSMHGSAHGPESGSLSTFLFAESSCHF